jgi:hypothetical protein
MVAGVVLPDRERGRQPHRNPVHGRRTTGSAH